MGDMSTARPSLLERAAEIYDFQSGLPVRKPEDLPPPRPRPAPRVEEARAPQQPRPVEEARAPEQPRRQAQPRQPVPHAHVELDAAVLAHHGLLTPEAPPTGLAEEVRLVKRRLLTAVDQRTERGDERARIILVASAQPGEGKTFIAANLALSIAAERDRSVLLIDGDSAKPELMTRFGVDAEHGFVDTLTGPQVDPETMVLDTDIEHFSLLPAGRKERNLPELLASARTEQVFQRLLEVDPRRIIIVDSPPALAASAAGVLATHAGQTLVVVRADVTSEADLNETIDLLSGCDHLSLVLNSAAFQVGGRRFGKYEEYR